MRYEVGLRELQASLDFGWSFLASASLIFWQGRWRPLQRLGQACAPPL